MSRGPRGAGRFGEELERYRQARKLIPAEAARQIGVSTSQYSRWRHGGGISIDALQRVADWMGRPRADLEALAGYPAQASSAAHAPDTDDAPLLAVRAAWSGLDECDKAVIQKIALGRMSGTTDAQGPRVYGQREQRAGTSFTGRDLAELLRRVASPDAGFATDLERIRAEWRAAPHRQNAW